MRKGLDKYGHHHGLLNVSRFSEHEESCLRKLSSYSIDYSSNKKYVLEIEQCMCIRNMFEGINNQLAMLFTTEIFSKLNIGRRQNFRKFYRSYLLEQL